METSTTLLEFRVPSETLKCLVRGHQTLAVISNHLQEYGFILAHEFPGGLGAGSCFHVQYCAAPAVHASLRGHNSGLITLDVFEYVSHDSEPLFSSQLAEALKKNIEKSLQAKNCLVLPPIIRGAEFNCYFPTSDNKLIEYDFTRVVHEEQSEHQNIKIYHSPQFGNMLILDDDPNLAESDLAYTEAITGGGRMNYADKTVLILGGGDGGILHELKKHQPKHITMLDIDSAVVEAARKHLRGICHDALDELSGPNWEVQLVDCLPVLKDYVAAGRLFDYVINDLTAVPVGEDAQGGQGSHWDFLRTILDLSMKVLASDGHYFTQGHGANMTASLAMYEKQLKALEVSVQWKTSTVCVPSYHEMWVFYEVWKSDSAHDTL